MLTVETAATSSKFAFLSSIKTELDISTTDYDDVLDDMLDEAGSEVERITGRVFASEEVTEVIPGSGNTNLLLARTPITTGSTDIVVKYYGQPIVDFVIEDVETGILFRESFWSNALLAAMYLQPIAQSSDRAKNFAITYRGGYEMCDSTGTVTLPTSLQRIVKDAVVLAFKRKGKDPGLKDKTLGDAREVYSLDSNEASFLESRLNRWIRVS